MSDSVSAYRQFVQKSAELYLQTVVLIDDHIYESRSGSVAVPLIKPGTSRRKAALRSVDVQEENVGGNASLDAVYEKHEEVSFHDVQNSFAKKRIICSLYQPKKTASFSDRSEVYSLCSAADVVVVDWDIHGDVGNKATELVCNLIQKSMEDIPYQLRLILIYTMEVNLGAVASAIYERLKDQLGDNAVSVESGSEGLVLGTVSSRIVVLGKRDTGSLTQYAQFFVPESKLAERTVVEFSHLASGLLQSIVLRGIARLRENNRRILMRFHSDLDSPFLTHRALLLPEDAIEQIIPLLTDELRAILEDTMEKSPLGNASSVEEIITDWCGIFWQPERSPGLNIGQSSPDAREFAIDVFCNGPEIKKDYSRSQGSEIPGLITTNNGKPPAWNTNKCVKLAEYLSCGSNGYLSHVKLSSLMSQRIAYENARRTLQLGVILRELTGEKRYMICLQPVCDSVRLNGKTRTFIFSFLDYSDDAKHFSLALMDIKGNPILLHYKAKISDCHVMNFSSQEYTVCAVKDAEGRFIFKADCKKKYEWVAELKPEHAQRAAEEFGRSLSRVGLNESEWLRLKAK